MREKHSKANVKAGSTEQEAVKSGNKHVVKSSISHACAMNETFMCPSSEKLEARCSAKTREHRTVLLWTSYEHFLPGNVNMYKYVNYIHLCLISNQQALS